MTNDAMVGVRFAPNGNAGFGAGAEWVGRWSAAILDNSPSGPAGARGEGAHDDNSRASRPALRKKNGAEDFPRRS
jgi:hypothetical protein